MKAKKQVIFLVSGKVAEKNAHPSLRHANNQLSVLSLYIFLLISMKYYWVDDGDDDDDNNNDDHVCMITFPFMFYYYYKFGMMMMGWSQKTTHFAYKKYRTQSQKYAFLFLCRVFFCFYFFRCIVLIESLPISFFQRRRENNRLVFNNDTAASTLYICVFTTLHILIFNLRQ